MSAQGTRAGERGTAVSVKDARGRGLAALASAALLALAARPWDAATLPLGAGSGGHGRLAGAIAGADWLSIGWLALVAFVPLLTALRLEPRPVRAGLYLAAAALGPAFAAYEAIGPFRPLLLPVLVACAALPFAAAGALVPRLRRALGTRGVLAAFPLLWLAAETLPGRAWLLGPYATPLLAVGTSQAGLPAMQLARFGGLAGVGLAVLACNALLALVLVERSRFAVVALAVLAGAVAAAACTAAAPSPRPAGPLREAGHAAVRVVQLRVVQEALPDAAYAAAAALPAARDALVATFVRDALSLPLSPGPALTVWPEGALPGPLPARGPTGLEPLLQPLGPTLAGGPARVAGGVANAAFLWQDGALRHVYDKRHLAPITEAGLVRGRPAAPVAVGSLRVALLICFEAAFPELARQAALDGADVLAILTNDAFGRYLGTPVQHLRLARFRAVETGLPVAFASNAGPSAVIDAAGRILARTPTGRAAVAAAAPKLGSGPTPYVRWGDWPATLALAGSGLLALLAGALGGASRS